MARKPEFNRKIEKAVDKLLDEGNLFGLEFDDVLIKGRKVTASGESVGNGDTDLIIEFDKRARPTSLKFAIDYYAFNGRLIQGFEFSNYKKYEKSLKKERFQNLEARATNYYDGTKEGFQKGVDVMETIPGIGDMWINLISSEVPSFYVT